VEGVGIAVGARELDDGYGHGENGKWKMEDGKWKNKEVKG
jgi:hypothetical protein